MAQVTIEIGGRQFAVAPFKLGDLRRAAPFIDAMNGYLKSEKDIERRNADLPPAEREAPALGDIANMTRALIEILAIAISKVDPAMTADAIEDQVDFSFIASLQEAIMAILAESGLSRAGEAKAPSPPLAEGAES
jgi:hypothetical protein